MNEKLENFILKIPAGAFLFLNSSILFGHQNTFEIKKYHAGKSEKS